MPFSKKKLQKSISDYLRLNYACQMKCPRCGKENAAIPVSYTVCLQCILAEKDQKEGTKTIRYNQHLEDDIQEAFFSAARVAFPKLGKLLFAVPNGGKRDKKEAIRLQRQGVVPGVSDILCLIPNEKYSYLCLETKTSTNNQSDHQTSFEIQSVMAGGLYKVFRSAAEGIEILKEYLKSTEYK